MNFQCTLYLIRHGETEFNKKDIVQGGLDSPLTATGIYQAELLGKFLGTKLNSADLWFCSTQGRAVHTTEILRSTSGISDLPEVIFDNRLREIGCGTAEGKHRSEIPADLIRGIREDPYKSYIGGESMDDAFQRCISFKKDFYEKLESHIQSRSPDDPRGRHINAVITAHGHLNRALAAALTGMPTEFSLSLAVDNTGLSVLKGPENKEHFRIHLWNQTVHLDRFIQE
jgi:broad specificity phosphatase PhoE